MENKTVNIFTLGIVLALMLALVCVLFFGTDGREEEHGEETENNFDKNNKIVDKSQKRLYDIYVAHAAQERRMIWKKTEKNF